jgi:hypothetical protein
MGQLRHHRSRRGEELPSLIGRAEAARYDAKLHGRDQVIVHDPTDQANGSGPGIPRPAGKSTVALA